MCFPIRMCFPSPSGWSPTCFDSTCCPNTSEYLTSGSAVSIFSFKNVSCKDLFSCPKFGPSLPEARSSGPNSHTIPEIPIANRVCVCLRESVCVVIVGVMTTTCCYVLTSVSLSSLTHKTMPGQHRSNSGSWGDSSRRPFQTRSCSWDSAQEQVLVLGGPLRLGRILHYGLDGRSRMALWSAMTGKIPLGSCGVPLLRLWGKPLRRCLQTSGIVRKATWESRLQTPSQHRQLYGRRLGGTNMGFTNLLSL